MSKQHYWMVICILAIIGSVAGYEEPTVLCRAEEAVLPAWTEFRGPTGQGLSDQLGLPVLWSERKNVLWKVDIPGQGWSSPVVQGRQIWMTSALDSGRSLRAICVDRESGKIIHNVEVGTIEDPGQLHPKNSHASPTPIIAGDRLYVHFGAHATACLSTDGRILWRIQLPYYHHHGPAGSPVLVGDLLIVSCDGFTEPFWDRIQRPEVGTPQFIVGIDATTGQIRWQRPRDGKHSYSTPLAILVDGQQQVISPGGDAVIAYEPLTGKELWWCRFQGYSVTPRPVWGNGLVYVCTGYDQPSLLAIRTDGQNDVTKSHIQWKTTDSVPLTASPLLLGELLFLVSDNGIVSCLDAHSGKLWWKRRLTGNYSASPISAEGKIYFFNERGQADILEAATKYRKISTCTLSGRTLASPAVSGSSLIVRSEQSLYRIENGGAAEIVPDNRRLEKPE